MDSDTAKNIAMIKEAVLIHHNNPNTEAFKNAHLFLQKFRSDPSCINICLQICSIHESDEIRHFGLQTINMTINSHWKSFSPDQLSTIKEMCTKLITQGSKSVLQEKNYLKEKIVEIVCSVAINGWPNKWPNFFKDLLKISDHSESSLELVLKVLQNLRIETEINFKLPLLRRENIKQSLKSYNGEIYGLVEATFQGCVQNLKNVKTDSNNKMESVALSEALINSALDCLNPNIQFPMEYIFRDEMVDLLCLLCKQPAFFKKSMRCLTLICSKKHIVPQNISSKLYRDKVFLVWQTAIEILEAIISQNHKMDDFEQHLELCVDVIKFLIVNHKKITYRKSQNNKNLKLTCLNLLAQSLKVNPRHPHLAVFELWRTILEIKFIAGIKDATKINEGLFILAFEYIDRGTDFDTLEEVEEITRNLHITLFQIFRLLLKSNREKFVDLLMKKLQFLLSIQKEKFNDKKNKFGFAKKESKLFLFWDNYVKVLRLTFGDIYNRNDFSKENAKMGRLKNCGLILKLLIQPSDDPLISELIVRFMPRFSNFFYHNSSAFMTVVQYIFSIFGKFKCTQTISKEMKILKTVLGVRKAAVYTLIALSRSCKKLFYPFYKEIALQTKNIIKYCEQEEDLSGLYEFLLIISEDDKLKEERNLMILETFKDAGKKLSTPQITSYFNADNIILLLRPGETEWKTRQIIRVSLNTINALLRGVTKARVSYSNEYRLNYIPVLLVNSFQYDEVWNLAAAAVPFVSALCRALGGLYGDAASKADSDLATILRKPFFVTELLQRTENDSARHMRIRHVSAWINDMRDLCYTMLSLSSNLSDSFFTANPHFITEEVFYNIDKISLGNLKSIGDKLISTLVIRCAASLPQNLDSFLTPILGVFLHQATMRLGNAWQNHSDNLQKRSSQEDLSEEMGLQEELRIFTRGMSKLLYSFSLEISLQRIFERSKPRGIRSDRKEQFRINKILINYLFKSQKVCEPLLTLLSFFLRCPDSIARNNVHRFLLQATRIMCDQREYLETFAKLMVEAIKVQSEIREVDDNLIDFICLLIRLLRKTRRQLPQEVIAAGVPSIPSEDVDFLLNAFASKDTVLHRKKTKQFLLKLSGEEGIELYFERSGMHVNSVRRRTKRGGIAREKTTSFVDPVNLGLLFEGADSL